MPEQVLVVNDRTIICNNNIRVPIPIQIADGHGNRLRDSR